LYGKFLQNSQGHCDTKVCAEMKKFANALLRPRTLNCHFINDGSEETPFLASVDKTC
jgi:hypothetical protein